MTKANDVKWVYIHLDKKWVWAQVKVKYVGKRGDCLVDFLDGSGSSLFYEENLKDKKEL